MIYKILLIGAGNIGSRYLQGIKKCKLNIETKEYFESLLETFKHSAFGVHGAKKQFKYEKKCFKELERIILETK